MKGLRETLTGFIHDVCGAIETTIGLPHNVATAETHHRMLRRRRKSHERGKPKQTGKNKKTRERQVEVRRKIKVKKQGRRAGVGGLAIFILIYKMLGGPGLEAVVDQYISVITNDGRNIVGVLKGFDQATNIILDESHERVYSTKEGVQQLVLGLYIIRGDNISVIGELDEELDASLNLSELRAHPLKPVIH
ncbi:hypothetical protein E3N88_24059 [Mikania micrantha]|uniref:U6 snRNA-associated Sm-like protein LSm8 n=1 Tax=Mikania micrantha TaxID=192012 RepID=A0A5N6NHQ8_9ASTR|nr:hypothetical protein E3N88_24059 [Mikania micrantha]